MNTNKKATIVFALILMCLQLNAQIFSEKVRKFINSPSFSSKKLQYVKEIKEFYNDNEFQFCWLNQTNNLELLLSFIESSEELGLRQEDYEPSLLKNFIDKVFTPSTPEDSLLTEIKITGAAIHFFHDLMMGNREEKLLYNGLNYFPSCYNIPSLLNTFLDSKNFSFIISELESKSQEYLSAKSKLNSFQKITSDRNFKEVIVTSTRVNNANQPLITKLYQLGIISTDTIRLSDAILKSKLKEAQNLIGVLSDGYINSRTLSGLNIHLATRIHELELLLNTLRWIKCIKQEDHIIVVNIPSATLLLYENGKVVLESKIIAGKKSTPTRTLSSKITEVILYPYWNVPYKIATTELLPAIKHNKDYLETNNFQVLNKQGIIMNPDNINWHSLNSNFFPYVIRQSTGCDNSLGLIKLNFYNPFTVYLHDTPSKFLFNSNSRFYSHGCMRLQKAMEVGHYILKNNSIAIDTLTIKGCLKNQTPITVKATEIIPVFVLYNLAWIDSAAKVSFHEDVYNKFK